MSAAPCGDQAALLFGLRKLNSPPCATRVANSFAINRATDETAMTTVHRIR